MVKFIWQSNSQIWYKGPESVIPGEVTHRKGHILRLGLAGKETKIGSAALGFPKLWELELVAPPLWVSVSSSGKWRYETTSRGCYEN